MLLRLMGLQPPIFISYAGGDREWAEWIGWVLEEQGVDVVVQAWDFVPEAQLCPGDARRRVARGPRDHCPVR